VNEYPSIRDQAVGVHYCDILGITDKIDWICPIVGYVVCSRVRDAIRKEKRRDCRHFVMAVRI